MPMLAVFATKMALSSSLCPPVAQAHEQTNETEEGQEDIAVLAALSGRRVRLYRPRSR